MADAAARADRTGLFACPHTGVAFAALFKLIDKGVIQKDDRVIAISTAHGLKFNEFKLGYHRDELQNWRVNPRYDNAPVALPPDADAVKRAILERVEADEKLTG